MEDMWDSVDTWDKQISVIIALETTCPAVYSSIYYYPVVDFKHRIGSEEPGNLGRPVLISNLEPAERRSK